MTLPKKVTLVEVGPRDGFQNESVQIPTEIKIEFINRLSQTGLSVIEATSFVSPKWVPQLADHAEVLQGIDQAPGVRYPVLVPNEKGLENAMAAGAKEIAVFTAASDAFSQKNTNCSIEESLIRIETVVRAAKKQQISVRAYVSCVLGCPYEGDIALDHVSNVSEQLLKIGCDEISLGDTIGVGTPGKAQALIKTVSQKIPLEKLAIHFHDTYGQALANIYACLECGITTIDCSLGGLGGCPYAPGAGGNVATQDVLYMLNGLGIRTGVDLNKLNDVDCFIFDAIHQPTRSKVAAALSILGY